MASFVTLMNTNVGYNGKKMSLPMAGKLKTDEIKALYVYLKNGWHARGATVRPGWTKKYEGRN